VRCLQIRLLTYLFSYLLDYLLSDLLSDLLTYLPTQELKGNCNGKEKNIPHTVNYDRTGK